MISTDYSIIKEKSYSLFSCSVYLILIGKCYQFGKYVIIYIYININYQKIYCYIKAYQNDIIIAWFFTFQYLKTLLMYYIYYLFESIIESYEEAELLVGLTGGS